MSIASCPLSDLLARLPAADDYQPSPELQSFLMPDPENPRHRVAERLTTLTAGRVKVRYDSSMLWADDPDSAGHLFHGTTDLVEADNDTWLNLDDRQSEPLEIQLAAELRRVARIYEDLALLVELNAG